MNKTNKFLSCVMFGIVIIFIILFAFNSIFRSGNKKRLYSLIDQYEDNDLIDTIVVDDKNNALFSTVCDNFEEISPVLKELIDNLDIDRNEFANKVESATRHFSHHEYDQSTGEFVISDKVNKNRYKIEITKTIRGNHPVYYISDLHFDKDKAEIIKGYYF